MASTSGPSNQPGKQSDAAALASRCDQLRCENQMLRRALRKEREKCQFITNAYRQLLQQFDHLADLKTMMELSTSSPTPSGSEEGGGDRHKSRREARVVPRRTQSGIRIIEANKEEKRRKTKRQEQAGLIQREQGGQKREQEGRNDANKVGRALSRMSLDGNKENLATERSEKPDYPAKQRRNYEIVPPRSSVSVHDMTSSDFHISKANNRQNWYFVPLKEANNQDDKMEHIRELFKRSQERCEAIREASCIRAQIAANRRAVVADLLTGRRALDPEAFNVLHFDSSRVVSAFPDQFMRDRRSASRRSYDRSPVRQEQERERQRQFEGAVNRILAHSSATMSKMITVNKSRTATNNRVAPFRI